MLSKHGNISDAMLYFAHIIKQYHTMIIFIQGSRFSLPMQWGALPTISPTLNSNFHVITQLKLHFYLAIDIATALFLFQVHTHRSLLILISINVQYLENVPF